MNRYIPRLLSLSDAEEILRLQHQSTGALWTLESTEGLLKSLTVKAWGIMEGEYLIAFLIMRCVEEEGDIVEFVVDSSYRRQGIGNVLYTFAEQACLKNKLRNIFLEVSKVNLPAKKFYQNSGFVEIARRPNYYGFGEERVDAILMKKQLVKHVK